MVHIVLSRRLFLPIFQHSQTSSNAEPSLGESEDGKPILLEHGCLWNHKVRKLSRMFPRCVQHCLHYKKPSVPYNTRKLGWHCQVHLLMPFPCCLSSVASRGSENIPGGGVRNRALDGVLLDALVHFCVSKADVTVPCRPPHSLGMRTHRQRMVSTAVGNTWDKLKWIGHVSSVFLMNGDGEMLLMRLAWLSPHPFHSYASPTDIDQSLFRGALISACCPQPSALPARITLSSSPGCVSTLTNRAASRIPDNSARNRCRS